MCLYTPSLEPPGSLLNGIPGKQSLCLGLKLNSGQNIFYPLQWACPALKRLVLFILGYIGSRKIVLDIQCCSLDFAFFTYIMVRLE